LQSERNLIPLPCCILSRETHAPRPFPHWCHPAAVAQELRRRRCHPAKHVALGAAIDPKDMIPITDLNVKSVIAHPNEWAARGLVKVQGVAWSNASPLAKVEVSTDAGKSLVPCKLHGQAHRIRLPKVDLRMEDRRGPIHPHIARHQQGSHGNAQDLLSRPISR
jgi:hypothetical protein